MGYGAGGAGELKQNNVFPRVCWYRFPPQAMALDPACREAAPTPVPKHSQNCMQCPWAVGGLHSLTANP